MYKEQEVFIITESDTTLISTKNKQGSCYLHSDHYYQQMAFTTGNNIFIIINCEDYGKSMDNKIEQQENFPQLVKVI